MFKQVPTFVVLSLVLTRVSWAIGTLNPIPADQLEPRSCEVRILLKNGKRPTCTASLIDADILLSAAHCYSNDLFRPDDIARTEVTCSGIQRTVSRWIPHPEYKPGKLNESILDVALIEVEEAFPIEPLPLATKNSEIRHYNAKKQCAVFGYGLDWGWSNKGVKRGSLVTLEFNGQADAQESRYLTFRGGYVRPGDSGGGLVCRDKRLGNVLVAFFCEKGWGTEACSVVPHLKWVRSFLKAH